MDNQDPFDWDVEQVIAELTARTEGVMSGMVPATFRYNEVTGKILLTVVNMENLKTDLKIIPLGQRGKIIEQVERLQGISEKYLLHVNRTHVPEQFNLIRPLNLPSSNAREVPSQRALTLHTAQEPNKTTSQSLQLLLNRNAEDYYIFFSNPNAQPELRPLATLPSPPVPDFDLPIDEADDEREEEDNEKENPPNDVPHTTPGRILDLPPPSNSGMGLEPVDTVMSEETIVEEPSRAKRAFSVAVQPKQHRHRNTEKMNRGYLGAKALLVDDLFYGGRDIETEHNDSDADEDEFLILESSAPSGIKRYVSTQMKHFLKNAEIVEASRGGSRFRAGNLRTAVKPYRASLLRKHYVQSITVFDASGESCRVYQSTVDDTPLDWEANSTTSKNQSRVVQFGDNPLAKKYNYIPQEDNSLHSWDFLMKWAKIDDDKLLPPFNESGSENEYDLETYNEMLEEEEERRLALLPKEAKEKTPHERQPAAPRQHDVTRKGPAETVDIISRSPAGSVDIMEDDGDDVLEEENANTTPSPSSLEIPPPQNKGKGKESSGKNRPSSPQSPVECIDLTLMESEDEIEEEVEPVVEEQPHAETEYVDVDAMQVESEEEVGSWRRKRKLPELVEDISAKASRDNQHRFVKARAQRIKRDEKRRKAQGLEIIGTVVNKGKYEKENDIFFHPQIEERLKPHQIQGIQFLWQELIQSGRHRGALLAHTMGLGKTFQVIALLHTIAVAGASSDPKTYEQIPPHLRKSKSLILCPPTLVDNWWDEFHQFLPLNSENELDLTHTGEIFKITAAPGIDRERQILRWSRHGGILIISNHLFKNYVAKSERVGQILLEEPNIIVADEAHFMKNPNAAITKAASRFKSTSRIAITGSPLQNYLREYWTMIEWIDPGYLGPLSEFEQKYTRPIQDGLHMDSTRAEQRQSLKMLYTLKNDLNPKVHRMDITAISNLLPAKREFLITLPLTQVQKELYINMIEIIRTHRLGHFEATHLLLLVNAHPQALLNNLIERQKERGKAKRRQALEAEQLDENEGEGGAAIDAIDTPLSLVEPILEAVKQATAHIPSLIQRKHSYRTDALKLILKYSIAAKDRVLVFSHSIPTLDYLEKLLGIWKINFRRLDGKTPMGQRQQSTKNFNSGEGDVYLISTRAGGLGLNLFGANRVVIFDFKWSPTWEQQAVGRAYRIGQQKPVYVYRFIAGGTIEDYLRNMTDFKQQLATRVIDKKDPIRNSSKLGKILPKPPQEVEQDDLTEFKDKDPAVLDVLIKTKYVRQIKPTETFIPDDQDTLTEEERREADSILLETKRLRTEPGSTQINVSSTQGGTNVSSTQGGTYVFSTQGGTNVSSTQGGSRPILPPLQAPPQTPHSTSRAPLPFQYGSPVGSTSSSGEDEPQENFPSRVVSKSIPILPSAGRAASNPITLASGSDTPPISSAFATPSSSSKQAQRVVPGNPQTPLNNTPLGGRIGQGSAKLDTISTPSQFSVSTPLIRRPEFRHASSSASSSSARVINILPTRKAPRPDASPVKTNTDTPAPAPAARIISDKSLPPTPTPATVSSTPKSAPIPPLASDLSPEPAPPTPISETAPLAPPPPTSAATDDLFQGSLFLPSPSPAPSVSLGSGLSRYEKVNAWRLQSGKSPVVKYRHGHGKKS